MSKHPKIVASDPCGVIVVDWGGAWHRHPGQYATVAASWFFCKHGTCEHLESAKIAGTTR